ncbi:MAG: hypothetical protein QOD45_404, partial [Pseudonocardiales bacterium]|nr:hypothetical protein [Pseudonocardiales bacterium]
MSAGSRELEGGGVRADRVGQVRGAG